MSYKSGEPVFIMDLLDEDKTRKKTDEISEEDIANMLEILEKFGNSDVSRLNVQVSEEVSAGKSAKAYHHGRCDVGSPWAKGDAFDVLEDAKNAGCK
ncbi:MAG: hypothetical protein IJZ44_02500 [Lachnospiraceae bacterium]|nr:hypothetical protein [Lachnospiraceae bacterium]